VRGSEGWCRRVGKERSWARAPSVGGRKEEWESRRPNVRDSDFPKGKKNEGESCD